MSTVALARPGTAGTAIVSTATGPFKIHTQQVRIQVENRINEVTGENQNTPHFQHGGMSYTSFSFSGFVVDGTGSGSKIGVESLASVTATTGNAGDHTITFVMASGRTISGKAVFSKIEIQYGRNTPHVQVAISGVFSDVTNGVIETVPAGGG